MASYKIKDLELLTGIKAHTIRMWEKRYGILNPDRTDTQIRSYTDDELAFLLRVALLNKSGIKISRIAEMSINEVNNRVASLDAGEIEDSYHENLILALIHLDEHQFHQTLNQAIGQVGLERTFTEVLVPFLEKIGVMWLVGTINPAQEHFISNLIRQKIISEIDQLPIPPATDDKIMLFLPEHEWHEISLLFYNYLLRRQGKSTVYLGQSVPFDSLVDSVRLLKPAALVTSWLTSVDPKFMHSYFKRLYNECGGIAIYGGGHQIISNHHEVKNWVKMIDQLNKLEEI